MQLFVPGTISLAPAFARTGNVRSFINALVKILSTYSDEDVFIIGEVPAMGIPADFMVTNTNITSGTVYTIGLFVRGPLDDDGNPTFVVKSASAIATTIDMSSARLESAAANVKTIAVADRQKKFYELAGDDINTRKDSYFLGLVASTVGTADGYIGIDASYVSSVQ